MCNNASQQRSCSPTRTNANSEIKQNSESLLAIARHVDSGAKISAVTKASDSSTIVKIDSSPSLGTTMTLATLTALRVSFPFASTSATECITTGNTQFVVILKTNIEEIRHAKLLCEEFKSMRILKNVSNFLFVIGLSVYVALIYSKAISQLELM